MATVDPLAILTCPYDVSHQISSHRLQVHLKKCRQQYPNCDKVVCPFDSTHIVNDVELDFHVSTCSKRDMLDVLKYATDDEGGHHSVVMPPEPAAASAAEEDWDAEPTTSYIPDPTKRPSHIIMKVTGVTPSERRKARMEGIKNYRPPE